MPVRISQAARVPGRSLFPAYTNATAEPILAPATTLGCISLSRLGRAHDAAGQTTTTCCPRPALARGLPPPPSLPTFSGTRADAPRKTLAAAHRRIWALDLKPTRRLLLITVIVHAL